jgi:hypothetical protein
MRGQWDHLQEEEIMRPHKTKILLDGGDVSETRRIKQLLGFLDGQPQIPR